MGKMTLLVMFIMTLCRRIVMIIRIMKMVMIMIMMVMVIKRSIKDKIYSELQLGLKAADMHVVSEAVR